MYPGVFRFGLWCRPHDLLLLILRAVVLCTYGPRINTYFRVTEYRILAGEIGILTEPSHRCTEL